MSFGEYKIVVLGSGGVGKSALTIQFIQGNFVEKYDPTVEDSYRRQLEVDSKLCMLDILDTAGQEEYSAMRDKYMRSGEGFVLVFSLTDHASFDDISNIYNQLLRSKDAEEVPVMLVGNKCDLVDQIEVKPEEIKSLTKKWGNYYQYLEASAKTSQNVEQVFLDLVKIIESYRGETSETETEIINGKQVPKELKRKTSSSKLVCKLL